MTEPGWNPRWWGPRLPWWSADQKSTEVKVGGHHDLPVPPHHAIPITTRRWLLRPVGRQNTCSDVVLLKVQKEQMVVFLCLILR